MASKELVERYKELVAKRDKVNHEVSGKQKELAAINEQVILLQNKAMSLALEISTMRGNEAWLELKSEIGALAMAGAGRGVPASQPAQISTYVETTIPAPERAPEPTSIKKFINFFTRK